MDAPKNFLVIMSDEHNPKVMGCSGHPIIRTPALFASRTDAPTCLGSNITIRGASFYDDEYVKRDSRWLIKRTSYRRVYEELQPRGNVEGLSLTASWWATDGKSKLPAG